MKRILLWFGIVTLTTNSVLAQGTWTPLAGFTDQRAGSIAVGIGNKGYVGLGASNAGYLNDLWEFDPVLNTWSQKTSMPAPGRQAGIAFTINGKLYAGLGITQYTVYTDIYEFDPATNSWTPKANFGGGPKYGAMAFSIGNKGYVVGGKDPAFVNGTNDVWEFDPIANTWTQMSSAGPVLRSFGMGFSLNGKGYIGLGLENYDTRKKDIWQFDPVENAWTEKRDFPVERWAPMSFVIGNRAYVGAGFYYSPFTDFYEYNVAEDVWTPVSDIGGNGTAQGVAFSIGDKGYAGLGYDANDYVSEFYEFYFPRTPAVAFDPVSVTTLAGSGPTGFGEGGFSDGPGANARFNNPVDVAVDTLGNVYVADQSNNRIRKITPDGVVSTYAGSGVVGNADGTALTAQFNSPRGLTIDILGNIYVAEEGGNRIRKINTVGEVSTVAGDGNAGYLDGPALSAQFSRPTDVGIDAEGNLYVSDYENQRIRKISTDGMVSTIAANGEGGLSSWAISGPQGLAFDIYGNLYVQQIYGQLLKISNKGVVSTIDIPGLITGFQTGVTTDKNGNVYLTINPAENLDFIYKISPDGQAVLLAGGQAGYKDSIGIYAQFEYAIGITADKHGNLFIADEGNHRIRKLGTSLAEFSTLVGTPSAEQRFSVSAVNLRGDAFLTASGGFELSLTQGGSYSSSLSLSPVNGEINLVPVYVRMQASSTGILSGNITLSSDGAETQSLSVKGKVLQPALLFDPVVVSTVAGTGEAGFLNGSSTTAKFNSPLDVARDSAGNIYVADANNNRIRKITPAGVVSTFAGSGVAGNSNGNAATASFNHPHGVAVDILGNVYVGDEGNNLVRKITPAGIVSTFAGSGSNGFSDGISTAAQFSGPEDIIIDPAGNFYVVDGGNHAIRKITSAGQVITIAGDGVSGTDDGQGPNARFYYPKSVALDPYGNLWVTELYGQLRKISPSGMVSTVVTSEFVFGFRFGVVSDSAANIYVADLIDNTQNYIYKVTPGGTGALVAGGVNGFKDSVGAEARFSFPEGLAIDDSGDLYVADNGNNRIRKIGVPRLSLLTTAGIPSSEQLFSVSGVNLGSNVSIGAPSAFEISLTSGSGYTSSLSLTPVSAEVTSVPVYIRLKGTLGAGTYNGSISLSSSGAVTQTLGVRGVVSIDRVPPQIKCPGAQVFCFKEGNIYTVPLLSATDNVGIRNITYTITGATNRIGTGLNASGVYNPGTSTIRWRATDYAGNVSMCATTIRVNNRLIVSIPDTYPLLIWGNANTIYKGFGPTCALLIAVPSGGTPYPGLNGYRYSWSSGATTLYASVCPPNPGSYIYTVTVTDALGCTATTSKTIKVVDARCGPNGNEVVLCWFGRSQSCYNTWQAIIALYYGAKVGPCDASAVTITQSQINKEAVITPQSEMKAFPNPNKGSFTLRLVNLQVDEVRVLDQNGRLILKRFVNGTNPSQTIDMNLGRVANGIYLIQAIGKNGIYTSKVVVE